MQVQRETARAARKTTNYMGADATVYEQLDPAMTTKFVGYDELTCEGEIHSYDNRDRSCFNSEQRETKERSSLIRQHSMLQAVVRKQIKV